MAVRELVSVVQFNFEFDRASVPNGIHAGALVARSAGRSTVSNGYPLDGVYSTSSTTVVPAPFLMPADRSRHSRGAYVGVLADDTAVTGNTMIIPDPVGSTYIDPTTLQLVANNNGMYVAAKRALGDFQSENVQNVSNLTAGSGGIQGARRGVGVYTSPSAVLATDQFMNAAGSTLITNDTAAATYADAVDNTLTVNDILTYGTGANAGLFVKIDFTGSGARNSNTAIQVARVDKYDTGAGLLYVTMLI